MANMDGAHDPVALVVHPWRAAPPLRAPTPGLSGQMAQNGYQWRLRSLSPSLSLSLYY